MTVGGKNIAEIAALSIDEAADFLARPGARRPARSRSPSGCSRRSTSGCGSCSTSAWTTSRSTGRPATLSGGEAQRIRLATQIGSGLVGVLYVLDEPRIGLHQRDNHRLIETLIRLRDLGNTLIVVEHDEDTIRAADWVVDIGPGAGEHGGQVVVSGPVEDLLAHQRVADRRLPVRPAADRRCPSDAPAAHARAASSTVHGATRAQPAGRHRQRSRSACFDRGHRRLRLRQVDAGQRRSSTPRCAQADLQRPRRSRAAPHDHRRRRTIDKVIHVDQSPIGRTPRSNPATYTGVFDHVRKLFAETPEAKVRGYQPGRFSFNVKGGRCETCTGDGTIKIEMNFLPDVYVPVRGLPRRPLQPGDAARCTTRARPSPRSSTCRSRRPCDFFAAIPAIARHLKTLIEVGLGYVRLGQPAPTLSGGEAQRVKLAQRAAEAVHRPHRLRARRADHRSALRGHPQAARRAAPAWSTRATR